MNTLMRLKQIEQDAVDMAEHGNITGSIDKFSEAISICPIYASAYNNRYVHFLY